MNATVINKSDSSCDYISSMRNPYTLTQRLYMQSGRWEEGMVMEIKAFIAELFL